MTWSSGSLYSKHNPSEGSPTVNVAWQMVIAGLVFLPASLLNHEFEQVRWSQITVDAWLALAYLVLFGSIIASSAYVWLLQVRPATQVSTYAYVNPVIAVILGVVFAHRLVNIATIHAKLSARGLGIKNAKFIELSISEPSSFITKMTS